MILSPPYRTPDSLSAILAGDWSVSRIYEPDLGSFQGKATFTRLNPCSLSYRESGEIKHFTGQVTSAYQEYTYVFDAGFIEVLFSHGPNIGARFVRLNIDGTDMADYSSLHQLDAVHECHPDLYRVRYMFQLPYSFRTEIDVSGPRKRYRAISDFSRSALPLEH